MTEKNNDDDDDDDGDELSKGGCVVDDCGDGTSAMESRPMTKDRGRGGRGRGGA